MSPQKKRRVSTKTTKTGKIQTGKSNFSGESQSANYFKKIIIASVIFVFIGFGIAVWSYLTLKGIV